MGSGLLWAGGALVVGSAVFRAEAPYAIAALVCGVALLVAHAALGRRREAVAPPAPFPVTAAGPDLAVVGAPALTPEDGGETGPRERRVLYTPPPGSVPYGPPPEARRPARPRRPQRLARLLGRRDPLPGPMVSVDGEPPVAIQRGQSLVIDVGAGRPTTVRIDWL